MESSTQLSSQETTIRSLILSPSKHLHSERSLKCPSCQETSNCSPSERASKHQSSHESVNRKQCHKSTDPSSCLLNYESARCLSIQGPTAHSLTAETPDQLHEAIVDEPLNKSTIQKIPNPCCKLCDKNQKPELDKLETAAKDSNPVVNLPANKSTSASNCGHLKIDHREQQMLPASGIDQWKFLHSAYEDKNILTPEMLQLLYNYFVSLRNSAAVPENAHELNSAASFPQQDLKVLLQKMFENAQQKYNRQGLQLTPTKENKTCAMRQKEFSDASVDYHQQQPGSIPSNILHHEVRTSAFYENHLPCSAKPVQGGIFHKHQNEESSTGYKTHESCLSGHVADCQMSAENLGKLSPTAMQNSNRNNIMVSPTACFTSSTTTSPNVYDSLGSTTLSLLQNQLLLSPPLSLKENSFPHQQRPVTTLLEPPVSRQPTTILTMNDDTLSTTKRSLITQPAAEMTVETIRDKIERMRQHYAEALHKVKHLRSQEPDVATSPENVQLKDFGDDSKRNDKNTKEESNAPFRNTEFIDGRNTYNSNKQPGSQAKYISTENTALSKHTNSEQLMGHAPFNQKTVSGESRHPNQQSPSFTNTMSLGLSKSPSESSKQLAGILSEQIQRLRQQHIGKVEKN